MRFLALLLLSLLLTGCYNDPDITRRHPGEGPAQIHAGPAVGPGSTPGGSTAGPQKPKKKHGEHATPASSETHGTGAPKH